MTVSCTDGVIYVYNLEDTEPTLVKKVDGIVRALESDDQASSEVVWHPDGRAFVAPNATRGSYASAFAIVLADTRGQKLK